MLGSRSAPERRFWGLSGQRLAKRQDRSKRLNLCPARAGTKNPSGIAGYLADGTVAWGLRSVGAFGVREFSRHGASRGALAVAAVLACGSTDPADAAYSRRLREQPKSEAAAALPQGQLHIVVNVSSQRLSLYANGTLAARSAVSTGMRGHSTPTGVFSIIQKRRFHHSNIYSGAPMPFMQRITWSGIALHQGVVPGYPASHGCIRLPADFAQFLWKTTKIGARVIVARNDVEPYPFSHPLLPMPKSTKTSDAQLVQPAVKTAQAEITASDAPKNEMPGADATEAGKAESDGAEAPASEASAGESPKSALPETAIAVEAPAYPPTGDIMQEIRKSFEPNAIAEKPLPPGAVSVFVSRKLKRMFVRKGFEPLFDAPVEIRDESKPFGTHVFNATTVENGALRWLGVSLPPDAPKEASKAERAKADTIMREERSGRARRGAPAPAAAPAMPGAAEVLDRLTLPQDAMDRVRDMLSPGASFMVSDQGLGDETGEGTDFVVLTR